MKVADIFPKEKNIYPHGCFCDIVNSVYFQVFRITPEYRPKTILRRY